MLPKMEKAGCHEATLAKMSPPPPNRTRDRTCEGGATPTAHRRGTATPLFGPILAETKL